MRIGFGYDVHAFKKGRKLILGGEEIDFDFGLDGHSDADVLVHALMDSLLGALSLGDIGGHFPDTDSKYKGINSLILLDKVCALVKEKGYVLENADMTVVMQKPKIAGYIDKIRQNLSHIMKVPLDRISVKATTEEKLGFTGKGEGVKAYSVCLLKEI